MKNFRNLILTGTLILMPALSWAGAKVTPENDYRKGLDLYTKGHYEAALERFQLAIDGNWNFWQSYQMAGYCYYEMRDKEGALNAFAESLKINPRNPKLVKVVNDLKSGALEVPVRPVEAEAIPAGTPVYLQTYYTFNK
ncbi:MAG TPA: tetratricopeptide repeat protein [bacterium]|nr:tetratricopeptide repeat protein [bacterium]